MNDDEVFQNLKNVIDIPAISSWRLLCLLTINDWSRFKTREFIVLKRALYTEYISLVNLTGDERVERFWTCSELRKAEKRGGLASFNRGSVLHGLDILVGD